MEVGLVLFAVFVVFLMLRRGRRSKESYHEFDYPGLYSKEESDSHDLYGRHRENHLYPDREGDTPMHTNHSSKAS